MEKQTQLNGEVNGPFLLTPRDLLSIVFRRLRLIIITFLGLLVLAVLLVLLIPNQYQAEMKILINRERADPLVSSEAKDINRSLTITAQEVNSELEILKSQDLLEKVVISCGLNIANPDTISWWSKIKSQLIGLLKGAPDQEMRIAMAVYKLSQQLTVIPPTSSNLIKVTYASPDPKLSAKVLNSLAKLYIEKHLAVHRPPGTFDFFQKEAEQYRKGLALVEARLTDFGRDQGVVSVPLEKESTLRQLSEFETTLHGTRADIAMTKERIRSLEAQSASTSPRQTTQVRTSSRLLEQLQSTLLTLELKRTELLGVFKPDYPPVQEVEKQIAETRAAIAAAEKTPLVEQTTDRDQTHEWLRSELAKAQSELAASEARAATTAQTVGVLREKARRLGRMETTQQDLVRDTKLAEQNYLVYFGKQEDARISDALDRQRIMNVSIAEAATVPLLPSWPPRFLILLLGGFLASLVSLGLAFVLDYWDPSFRTPDELEALLNIPVAAAMPKEWR